MVPVMSQMNEASILKDVVIKTDTLQFRYTHDVIDYKGSSYFPFLFNKSDEVCELNLYPNLQMKPKTLELMRSPDFELMDSLVFLNNEYYRVKIKFNNLIKSQFLNFTFRAHTDSLGITRVQEIKLLPYTHTIVNFYPNNDELFIGEEKVFELLTKNPENIRINNEWTTGQDINYRISTGNGQLRIHLVPSVLGNKNVNIKLQTNSPFLNDKKEVDYDLPIISRPFKVKASRLIFLNIDKKEVTFDEVTRKSGVELQLDNHRQLTLGRTYRLEDQEQPGGPLIGELFTKSYLANDRVLCIFRPFNLHRQTEGYLYMKDGDDAKFITNINITPKTTITSIQVMHEAQSWTPNLSIFPGETVDVKIEGEGLHKAKFHWEELTDITSDTLVRSDNTCFFKLKVPLAINKRDVSLYNGFVKTGFSLNVREYQTPRNLDFITLNLGNGTKVLSTLNPTVIQRSTIPDITVGFNNNKIDSDNKLYGKQYVDIDIRIVGKSGELIEMKSIKNLLICPGDNSPRAPYYKDKACTNADISLNTQLSNKTYKLNDFSRVQLDIKQQSDKYNEPVNSKQVEIVLQRPSIFDIDVSFPAGLMIQNLGRTKSEKEAFSIYNVDMQQYNLERDAYMVELAQWTQNGGAGTKPTFTSTRPTKPSKAAFTDNLGGISLALIMQFSFPDAEKVGQCKPYRLGAGFLAINAFNFNQSAQRDLAAVVLASLYPIKPGKLFSLPIHLGFGYKFQDRIPFLMLSPGIGIQF
jgi:hypothetical protein